MPAHLLAQIGAVERIAGIDRAGPVIAPGGLGEHPEGQVRSQVEAEVDSRPMFVAIGIGRAGPLVAYRVGEHGGAEADARRVQRVAQLDAGVLVDIRADRGAADGDAAESAGEGGIAGGQGRGGIRELAEDAEAEAALGARAPVQLEAGKRAAGALAVVEIEVGIAERGIELERGQLLHVAGIAGVALVVGLRAVGVVVDVGGFDVGTEAPGRVELEQPAQGAAEAVRIEVGALLRIAVGVAQLGQSGHVRGEPELERRSGREHVGLLQVARRVGQAQVDRIESERIGEGPLHAFRNQGPVDDAVQRAAEFVAEGAAEIVAVFEQAVHFSANRRARLAETESDARNQQVLVDRVGGAEIDVVAVQVAQFHGVVEAQGQRPRGRQDKQQGRCKSAVQTHGGSSPRAALQGS